MFARDAGKDNSISKGTTNPISLIESLSGTRPRLARFLCSWCTSVRMTFISLEQAQEDPKVVMRLRDLLTDTSIPLHERFRYLFTLKAVGTDLAVEAIAAG